MFAGLHRDIRRRCQLRQGESANGLSARHALPRLRILVRTRVVVIRAISARWHRHSYLLAKRKEHSKGPDGHTGPSVT